MSESEQQTVSEDVLFPDHGSSETYEAIRNNNRAGNWLPIFPFSCREFLIDAGISCADSGFRALTRTDTLLMP